MPPLPIPPAHDHAAHARGGARSNAAWDRIGIAATALCVAHCLALPLLIPLAVAWGVPALTDPTTERMILMATLALACVVLLRGCRVHHHRIEPLLLAAAGGLVYACKGVAGHEFEPLMVCLGGAAIIGAHAWNVRLCRACAHG